MMRINKMIAAIVIMSLPLWSAAQRIHYSDPGRDDYRQVNFEIMVTASLLLF